MPLRPDQDLHTQQRNDVGLHRVSKTCQLIFCYMFVKYKPISIKIGRRVLSTRLRIKCPLHLKYVLALPWEIWCDWLSSQHVHFNASLKHDSRLYLKNRKICSKLHPVYTTCSKCSPPARTKISDVDELKRRMKNEWTVWITLLIERAVGEVAPASMCLRLCWRQIFRAYDVNICLTIFETITASSVCRYWMIH